jgi:hypothetical protein
MGFNHNIYVFAGIFALYGIYAAATEGVSKAWISISNEGYCDRYRYLFCFSSFFTMLASSMAGLIGTSLARTPLSSNCICQYFNGLYIFMTTEKSISISCPDYTHLYHNP